MVYGESEGRPVDRGNESRAGGGFDRALEQVEALWQDYPNLSRREQSRRLQRVRAIASTWGIDNNGQMRTLVRRILARPL